MTEEIPAGAIRSIQQIKEHYEIEKKLAKILRESNKRDRIMLYTALYDEMYRLVPHHPLLTQKADTQRQCAAVSEKMNFLKTFLKSNLIFLEVGAGDCSLSIEVSKYVKGVYAIDVSENIIKDVIFPQNCKMIISDGISIPVPENSVDVAYSDQLMEHLHPDDSLEQLKNIYKSLAPGGVYICITPSRLTGPHDISKYFDPIATGFHLKEYTVIELFNLMRKVGFSKLELYKHYKGNYFRFPFLPFKVFERIIGAIPYRLRRRLVSFTLINYFLGIRMVGRK